MLQVYNSENYILLSMEFNQEKFENLKELLTLYSYFFLAVMYKSCLLVKSG